MARYKGVDSSVSTRSTKPCHLVLVNQSSQELRLTWVNFQGCPVVYSRVAPGKSRVQSTFSTHTWVAESDDGIIFASYVGPSAVVKVTGIAEFTTEPMDYNPAPVHHPRFGHYGTRVSSSAVDIKCHDCVAPEAIQRANDAVTNMLAGCPAPLLRRMRDHKAGLAIIGVGQHTGDIPEFRFHKWDTAPHRGYGGRPGQPVACCGEENVLMLRSNTHKCESILVHEVGHSVMNLGFDPAMLAEVKQLHSDARASGRWDNSAYIMSNAQEFFAEATQAWFEATVRTDVTSGLRTKHELHRRDPALAAFMLRVYGGNDWVFPDTAPGRFSRAPPKCARVATGEIRRRLQGPGDASTGEAAAGDAGGAVGGAPHAPAGPRARKFAAMKRNLQDVMEDAKGGFRALFAPSLS